MVIFILLIVFGSIVMIISVISFFYGLILIFTKPKVYPNLGEHASIKWYEKGPAGTTSSYYITETQYHKLMSKRCIIRGISFFIFGFIIHNIGIVLQVVVG